MTSLQLENPPRKNVAFDESVCLINTLSLGIQVFIGTLAPSCRIKRELPHWECWPRHRHQRGLHCTRNLSHERSTHCYHRDRNAVWSAWGPHEDWWPNWSGDQFSSVLCHWLFSQLALTMDDGPEGMGEFYTIHCAQAGLATSLPCFWIAKLICIECLLTVYIESTLHWNNWPLGSKMTLTCLGSNTLQEPILVKLSTTVFKN